jgi:hypothetical protein
MSNIGSDDLTIRALREMLDSAAAPVSSGAARGLAGTRAAADGLLHRRRYRNALVVRRVVAAIFVAAALIAAVVVPIAVHGGSSKPRPSGPSTTVPLTKLRAMLLTLKDMPAGWTEVSSGGAPTRTGCPALANLRERPMAEVTYSRVPPDLPLWNETLIAVPSAQVTAILNPVLQDINEGCLTLQENETHAKLVALQLPQVGDQSGAWEATASAHGTPELRFYVVIARFGSVIGFFAYVATVSSIHAFRTLMHKAASRIDQQMQLPST